MQLKAPEVRGPWVKISFCQKDLTWEIKNNITKQIKDLSKPVCVCANFVGTISFSEDIVHYEDILLFLITLKDCFKVKVWFED